MAKSLFKELKRRNVFKVSVAYIILAWVVIQVTSEAVPSLHLPEWINTAVFFFGIIGFPFAIFFAWAYEITPDGIKKEPLETPVAEPQKTVETEATIDEKSIAVLPFLNMSTDTEQQHFCDGLSEELLNVLANLADLRVASRTSCFAFKDKTLSLKEIANKLQVAHILEGSVRKNGANIRITAQLIEVETDSHLWSETYDRQLDDIFAIQDDIATRIRDALKLKLTTIGSDNRITSDSKAYEYFLLGTSYSSSRGSKDQELAIDFFQKAVKQDPGFVRAWAKLAEISADFSIHSTGGDRCITIAKEASDKAIEIAPQYSGSYVARGVANMAIKKYAEADTAFFKAIDLEPDLAVAYSYLARSSSLQGKLEKALEYFVKSSELNSDDYESPLLALSLFLKFGDKPNVERMAKLGVERAKRELENHAQNPRAYYLGAGAFLALGDIKQAKEWAECAYKIAPDDTSTQYNLACIYALLGEHDKALDFLENSNNSKRWIENDPDLESLRDHPRYQAVLDALSD